MSRRASLVIGLAVATLASGCSSSADGEDGSGTTTTAAASTTSSTTADTVASADTTVTSTGPAASTTVAPPPSSVPATTPPAAPTPPSTTAPSAPKVPSLNSVQLGTPLPSCNPGDVLTITITFRAANAAGVTVWSSYDGNLGQYPAEFGSVDVPYTCINGQVLFTLQPVAEGGALGTAVDLYV